MGLLARLQRQLDGTRASPTGDAGLVKRLADDIAGTQSLLDRDEHMSGTAIPGEASTPR
jgi:hypothetical protein